MLTDEKQINADNHGGLPLYLNLYLLCAKLVFQQQFPAEWTNPVDISHGCLVIVVIMDPTAFLQDPPYSASDWLPLLIVSVRFRHYKRTV